jgi:hypothetical protein
MERKWGETIPVHAEVERSISDAVYQKRKRQEPNLRAAKCAIKVLPSDFILWVIMTSPVRDF